jgi:hypothetical protein
MKKVGWGLVLLGLVLLFWKLRIVEAATHVGVAIGNRDLHIEHYPMAKYGFGALASGRLPVWNPYQLTGMPFFAVPHVGLLYPGNWIYLFIETARAIELSFVLHSFLAGLGSVLLMRALGLSRLAGWAAALTFMWSGWMIGTSNQAVLFSGMSWLPITLFLVERTVRGRRLAGIGLALAVSCQVLNGATEFFVHNMYASGGFAAFRLAGLWLGGEPRAALARGAGLLGAVLGGVLLSAVQLLPSLGLADISVRSQHLLTFEQALKWGTVPPWDFLARTLRSTGGVAVGVLPFASRCCSCSVARSSASTSKRHSGGSSGARTRSSTSTRSRSRASPRSP